jgi:endonuclease YncB( thermonuclease family)
MIALARTVALVSLALSPSGAVPPLQTEASREPPREEAVPRAPQETVELVRVESGDTFHVRRKQDVERVHLLSVDTEEPIAGRDASAMTKPQTPFGDECLRWTQELFRSLAGEDGVTRFGLYYPDGELRRDVYGRILCHVILPDGEDLNLRLVREGRSPYYNKYGNSLVCHEAFVAAQADARAAAVGVWDPDTNSGSIGPRGVQVEKRPYPELIAWWAARAAAIEEFRRRSAAEPLKVVSAEDPDALAQSVEAGDGGEVEVFGEIARFSDEGAGARRVLLRGADRERSLSVLIPGSARAAHEALRLESRHGTFRQNYFFVRGSLVRHGARFEIVSEAPSQWRVAGPEPTLGD